MKRFEYQKLNRIETNNERFYITPFGNMPSVTTILSAVMDKSFLNEWRERVGETEADNITKTASRVGTLMHEHLEAMLQNSVRPKEDTILEKHARKMADAMAKKVMPNISEVYGIEVSLYSELGYAGSCDLIANYKNEDVICDWKNSKYLKNAEEITDYFLQITAYGLAHNEIYNTNISAGYIFMVSRETLEFDEYRISFDDYKEQFYDVLATYWQKKMG